MKSAWHFPVFVLVSLIAFVGVLLVVLQRRSPRASTLTIGWVSAVVVVGGMVYAKAGTIVGFPPWLYYGVPAALTWVLPPLVFRMRGRELATYLPLALLVAPLIHVLFSLFLGWKEYMPFIPVPSLRALIG